MPDVHARLSASGSSRWLKCTPSVELESKYPDKGSIYAAEGTLAHEVAELKLIKYFKKGIGPKKYKAKMDEFKANEYWKNEIDSYTDYYFDYIKKIATGLDTFPFVAIEKRVNYEKYAPGGFGTADCILIQGDTIHICDLKYGKGVKVSAVENTQLMLYALGAYNEYGFIYPIEKAILHIIQPRLDNYSQYEISISDLLDFGKFVKKQADLAIKGQGEFVPGEHCRFCKAKAKCRARADKNIELAGFTKIKPVELTNEEIGIYLEKAIDIAKWVKDLEEYALAESLAGREVKGWKAVEGRSNRKITDEKGLADKLIQVGYDEVMIYKPKQLETITKLEKLVGKNEFVELSVGFVEKPKGKPTLVKDTDKREAITNIVKAEEVFK